VSQVQFAARAAVGLDADTRKLVDERMGLCRNLMVEYSGSVTATMPDELQPLLAKTNAVAPSSGSFSYKYFRLDDRFLFETRATEKTVAEIRAGRSTDVELLIQTFTKTRSETATYRAPTESPFVVGVIEESRDIPPDTFIEQLLLIRPARSQRLLTADVLTVTPAAIGADGDELVLTLVDAGGEHRWTLDKRTGAVREYALAVGEKQDVQIKITVTSFQTVDGKTFPSEFVATNYGFLGGKRFELRKHALKVDKIALASPTNVPELYFHWWPIGSVVGDLRTGRQFAVVTAPLQLTDDAELRLVKKEGEPESKEDREARIAKFNKVFGRSTPATNPSP
jgi:hypothetical protein